MNTHELIIKFESKMKDVEHFNTLAKKRVEDGWYKEAEDFLNTSSIRLGEAINLTDKAYDRRRPVG